VSTAVATARDIPCHHATAEIIIEKVGQLLKFNLLS